MNLNFNMIAWINMLATNVPRLCEGWDLEALSFKLAQSLIEFLMLKLALQPSFCKTAVISSGSFCHFVYSHSVCFILFLFCLNIMNSFIKCDINVNVKINNIMVT